jgi:hypothetical protein
MDDYQKFYYRAMLRRNRLVPLRYDGKFIGFVTFFIGNGNPSKYIRDDSWSLVDDEPLGDTCYIDHIIGSKDTNNHRYSIRAYNDFKQYIRDNFPNVRLIRGNRFRRNKLTVHRRRIR